MVRSSLFVLFLTVSILSACGGGTVTQTAPSAQPPLSPPTSTATSDPPTVPPSEAAPTVSPTVSAAPTQAAGTCTDSAAFVADVTVPDNTRMDPGEAFTKTWRIRNTGDCTWTSGYTLVFKTGEPMGAPASSPLERETTPGGELDLSVNLTAPSQAAAFRADFEIHDPAGRAIPIDQATTLWVIITVGGGTSESNTPVPVPTSEATPAPEAGDLFNPATCDYSTSQPRIDSTITAINAYRAANGLTPLILDSRLSVAAQAHSADMACNSLFMHRGSDGSTPTTRVAMTGYAASGVTENTYGSYPPLNGSGVVAWWAADQIDPNHNANLLTTKYTQIGVGYAFFDEFGYYVVVFASP